MGGRSVFISVRALGGIYQNYSTEIYTGKQSFTNLDVRSEAFNHSCIFGRVGNMDLGRLESKSGGMKVITQNSDPQHPLLARQPEVDRGERGRCWCFYS